MTLENRGGCSLWSIQARADDFVKGELIRMIGEAYEEGTRSDGGRMRGDRSRR